MFSFRLKLCRLLQRAAMRFCFLIVLFTLLWVTHGNCSAYNKRRGSITDKLLPSNAQFKLLPKKELAYGRIQLRQAYEDEDYDYEEEEEDDETEEEWEQALKDDAGADGSNGNLAGGNGDDEDEDEDDEGEEGDDGGEEDDEDGRRSTGIKTFQKFVHEIMQLF